MLVPVLVLLQSHFSPRFRMPATKKYKLFSITDGKKPVCAFFLSAAGCRNGEKCPFLHEAEGKRIGGGYVEVSDSASIISSESEGDENRKKRKENSNSDDKNSFENRQLPAAESVSSFPSRKKKPRHSSGLQQGHQCETRSSSEKLPRNQLQTKKLKQDVSCDDDDNSFASHVPVALLSTLRTKPGAKESEFSSSSQPKNNMDETAKLVEPKDRPPLPTSTERGRKWRAAVLRTREHERYSTSFDFVRYKQKSMEAGIQSDWIKAKSFGSWCSSNPQAIAIDCEMCETQDPLSGSKNPKALCRISVVNAECPDEVLLDTLVKPNWPVCDYRTRINGIKKEHLENVQFTLRHAQAFMMALCSDETVIVGHAVHNDLIALNMEHHCIADSSFLYHAKDSSSATVSLRDVVSTIFQEKMPETHDSVNDARKALESVVHWVKNSGNVAEIERRTTNTKSSQLFVHRVPTYCNAKNLYSMFQTHADIIPEQVDEVEFSGTTGKTHVTFRTSRHAKLAFDTLDGSSEPDKSGRLQKKVYLKNGDYVRIRKMVHEKVITAAPDDELPAKP